MSSPLVDNSHLPYEDQVRQLSNSYLIREIEVMASNVQYMRNNQRDFMGEMDALMLCFEEVKRRMRLGRFR